jgi:hypothetical protein
MTDSRADRFTWKEGDLCFPSCNSCRNLFRGSLIGDSVAEMALTCKAYPDGIPKAIIGYDHDHRTPFEGDNGTQYDPDPARATGNGNR